METLIVVVSWVEAPHYSWQVKVGSGVQGESCGTQFLTCGICTNSVQLVSEFS